MTAEHQPKLPARIVAAVSTPIWIRAALVMFGFAFVTPFVGLAVAEQATRDGWGALEAFAIWFGLGTLALLIAIVCTIIGANRQPRSRSTKVAIVLSILCVLGPLLALAAGFSAS